MGAPTFASKREAISKFSEKNIFHKTITFFILFSGATFEPQPTSYDYDAPLTEAGDLTLKFFEIRTVIELYNPPDRIILPPLVVSEKMHLPPIELKWKCSVFDVLDTFVDSRYPLTFEQLDHPYGYMLYTTQVPFHAADPAVLSIPGLHDRAQVFVDKVWS